MLTLFLRWFKGLIIGWLMSLIFFLVRRALTKAFGQMNGPQQGPAPHPRRTSTEPPRPTTPQSDIIETIWIGMTSQQLRQSFGNPISTRQSGTEEIWNYPRFDGQNGFTEITLENDTIKKWQDVEPTLPSLENSAR